MKWSHNKLIESILSGASPRELLEFGLPHIVITVPFKVLLPSLSSNRPTDREVHHLLYRIFKQEGVEHHRFFDLNHVDKGTNDAHILYKVGSREKAKEHVEVLASYAKKALGPEYRRYLHHAVAQEDDSDLEPIWGYPDWYWREIAE